MIDELERWMENNPICPFCGHKHEWEEYWELLTNNNQDTFEINCANCDKEFIVEYETELKFTSLTKLEKENNE